MKYLYFLLFPILLMFLASCEKEDGDNSLPEITISAPYEGQDFNVLDTINIVASLEDDETISTVRITLVNQNFIPIDGDLSFSPQEATFSLNTWMLISDPLLESGTYYIKINASDGKNQSNAFVQINISGIPRELKNIIVISGDDADQLNINLLNESLQTENTISLSTDFADAAVNSNKQQLYIAGRHKTDLLCLNLESGETEWEIEPQNNPPHHNKGCLHFHNEMVFVSYYDAYLKGYDDLGYAMYNTYLEDDHIPTLIMNTGNYVLTCLTHLGERYMFTFYRSSGVYVQHHQIDFTPVELLGIDDNTALLMGNNDDQPVIRKYRILENQLIDLPVSTGRIYTAVFANNNSFLIATPEGIYTYDYQNSVSTLILTETNVNSLAYEKDDNLLAVGQGQQVKLYYYPSGMFINEAGFDQPVLDLRLLYNK